MQTVIATLEWCFYCPKCERACLSRYDGVSAEMRNECSSCREVYMVKFQKQEMKTLYDLALEHVAPDDRKISEHQQNEIEALVQFSERVLLEYNITPSKTHFTEERGKNTNGFMCVYCGFKYSDNNPSAVIEHVLVCEKRPEKKLLEKALENDAKLRATIRGYELALNEVFRAYPEYNFPETTQAERDSVIKQYPGFIDRTSAMMGRHIARAT